MKYLSLFSGIGAMDYGMCLARWTPVGQVEIDPFCRRVLAKHWPEVWRAEDVRAITGDIIREQCGQPDAIIGGPPCQPASVAGARKGASDDRWLWPDFLRMVREVSPLYVLAENPGGVLSLDIEGVRFDQWITFQLKNLGYSVLPILLSAEDVGAPHERERIWFVAYADRFNWRTERYGAYEPSERTGETWNKSARGGAEMENASCRRLQCAGSGAQRPGGTETIRASSEMGHANGFGSERKGFKERRESLRLKNPSWPMGQGFAQHAWEEPRVVSFQSQVGIAGHGDARRLARWRRAGVKAIGNAAVPQCVAIIARAIAMFHRKKDEDSDQTQ